MFDTEPTRSQPEPSPLLMFLVTLISLNLHGLLWILQPKLPVFAKPASNQQGVKLVQLTPAEIRRVTEFSRTPLQSPPQALTGSRNASPGEEPARSNIPLPQPPNRPQSIPTPTPSAIATPPASTPTPSATTPPASTPTPTRSPNADASLKSRYGYNPSDTTEAEDREKLRAWLRTKRRFSRSLEPRAPIPYSIKSPVSEKLPDVTPANVAVLVSPKGLLRGEPELIRSSGYESLDRAVIEDVKTRSFPATGEYVVYQYRIEIEQNNLPSPPNNLPSSPTSTPDTWTFPRPQLKN